MYMQGDVGLKPASAVRGKRIPNRPLAYGESTGHSHRIVEVPDDLEMSFTDKQYGPNVLVLEENPSNQKADRILMNLPISENMELYEDEKGVLTLKLNKRSALVHEDHMTHILSPGIYEYQPQVEYTPKSIQRVQD